MLSRRLWLGVLACLACAVGCAETRVTHGEAPQPDGSVQPMDDAASPLDAGDPSDSLDADVPPIGDASPPGDDAAVELDAAVSLDAGELDAEVRIEDPEPLACSGYVEEPHVQIGSPSAPLVHSIASGPLQGNVDWRGRAFIRLTGMTIGQGYSIGLYGHDLDLAVFADEDAFGQWTCMSGTTVAPDPAVCIVVATATSMDVTVHAHTNIRPFTLSAVPIGHVEGSEEAPLPIALGDLPRELNTEPDQASFYEITGVTPGTTYVVTGTTLSPRLQLGAYGGPVFDHVVEPQLSPTGAVWRPTGTSFYVVVIGPATGESVSLDVAPATHASEGSSSAPVMLDASDLPYDGEVGWSYNVNELAPSGEVLAASLYRITGLTPGNYVVSLKAPPRTELRLASGPGAPCTASALQETRLECGTNVSGTTLDVRVESSGGGGSAITLDIEEAVHMSEGTSLAPVELSRAELPYAGQTLGLAASHYRISGLTTGDSYLVRASDLPVTRADIRVLDDATLRTLCEISNDGDDAQCTIVPNGASVTVRVTLREATEGRYVGGGFLLDLIELDTTLTSTYAQPIPMLCTEGRAESVLGAGGPSFYRISGLSSGMRYIIEARSRLSLDIAVFGENPDPDPSAVDFELCGAFGDATHAARCLITATHGSVIVRVKGEAIGDPLELIVRRPHGGSQGAPDAPVAIDQPPFTGTVATAASSHFAILGLTPGATYTLRVASSHEDVMVAPFGDLQRLNSMALLAASAGQPAEVQLSAATEAMLLDISLIEPSDWVTDVRIDLVPE